MPISSIIPAISIVLFAFLGLFIYLDNRKSKINQTFSLVICLSLLWIMATTFADAARVYDKALFWVQVSTVGPFGFFPAFTYFTSIFPVDRSYPKKFLWVLFLPAIIGIALTFSKFNVKDIQITDWGTDFVPGPLYFVLLLYIFVCGALITINLIKNYKIAKNDNIKKQLKSIWLGGLVMVVIGLITNLALPVIFNYGKAAVWGPSLGVFMFIIFVGHAIVRYHLLNIKVIATQIFTFFILVIFLVDIFLSKNISEYIIRGIFFIAVSFFSGLLIKSVINEVKQKERLAKLAGDLKESNSELEKRNEFLVSLQRFTSKLTEDLNYKHLAKNIVNGLFSDMKYLGGILFKVSKNQDLMLLSSTDSDGFKKMFSAKVLKEYSLTCAVNKQLLCQVVKGGEMFFGNKLTDFIPVKGSARKWELIQQKLGAKTIVAVPIRLDKDIDNILMFFLSKNKRNLSEIEINMIKILTDQVSIVMRNALYYEQVQVSNKKLEVANEHLVRFDKAKSEFLSIASHQLRTPLTVIKGYLSMMKEGFFGPIKKKVLREVVDKVSRSTDRLINLVNDLLNVSRIESGRLKLDFQAVQLEELTASLIDELMPKAKETGIKIHFKKPSKLSPVWVDKAKISEVIINLIDNALKYTLKKGSQVDVFLKESKGLVRFTVKDQGIGIPKNKMGQLFKKFSRLEDPLSNRVSGTGLGLFVCRKLIEETFKGKVWVESRGTNKGSSFIFTLKAYKK